MEGDGHMHVSKTTELVLPAADSELGKPCPSCGSCKAMPSPVRFAVHPTLVFLTVLWPCLCVLACLCPAAWYLTAAAMGQGCPGGQEVVGGRPQEPCVCEATHMAWRCPGPADGPAPLSHSCSCLCV